MTARTTWENMHNRCNNPNYRDFHLYGGRGIKVCKEWFSFETFLKDMGEPPIGDYGLDRIDNMQGYSKRNCRWADRFTQNTNQRIRKDNTSKIRGVSLLSSGKWQAEIMRKYTRYYLGTFDTVFEAACARKAAENCYIRTGYPLTIGENHAV